MKPLKSLAAICITLIVLLSFQSFNTREIKHKFPELKTQNGVLVSEMVYFEKVRESKKGSNLKLASHSLSNKEPISFCKYSLKNALGKNIVIAKDSVSHVKGKEGLRSNIHLPEYTVKLKKGIYFITYKNISPKNVNQLIEIRADNKIVASKFVRSGERKTIKFYVTDKYKTYTFECNEV